MPHLTHSPAAGHLGCFQFLAIMIKATINMCTCFCMTINFYFFWLNMDFWVSDEYVLNFIRNCLFSKVTLPFCIPHQQCVSVSSLAFGTIILLFPCFCLLFILVSVECFVFVTLICISINTNDIVHFLGAY